MAYDWKERTRGLRKIKLQENRREHEGKGEERPNNGEGDTREWEGWKEQVVRRRM